MIMQRNSPRRRWSAAVAAGALAFALGPGRAAAQDGGDDTDAGDIWVGATSDGDSATGTVGVSTPGAPGTPGTSGGDEGGGGGGGPNCTRRDGTPDYLRYEGLQVTTMEEQRTEIRPEEQRPGVYLHIYCGDEYIGFEFFPDGDEAAAPVDPRALARSVTITPPAPVLATSPAAGEHLVGVEAWFWVQNWDPVTAPPATVGAVTVEVEAVPVALVIDPGDGSPQFTCTGRPPAYDTSLPASAQSSSCTHTYDRADADVAATAALVYDVSYSSNVDGGGDLDPIDTVATLALTVNEAQALVVG